MKVVLIVNTRSGRGVGQHVGAVLEDRITGAGHVCVRLDVGPEIESRLPDALHRAGALVIAGGDGTVHHAARAAIDAGVPVHHVPLGTENLFARQFAMTRDADGVLDALAHPSVARVDAAEVDGRVFLVMCSVGADASIIHRLHAERTGAIRRLSYAPHIAAEALRPSLPRLTIVADGREIVVGRRGLLIVANSRQYAARMDPVHDASMTDGRLDVLFMPATTTATLCLWALRCWLRAASGHPSAVHERAERVEIAWEGAPPPAQIDGEAFVFRGEGARLRVLPSALRVLTPDIGAASGTVGAGAAGAKEGADADETRGSWANGRGDRDAAVDEGGAGGGSSQPAAHR
ncbi:MAG: diacylglycerol/lipid kinase family protein [Phycisphaerales bacterium]